MRREPDYVIAACAGPARVRIVCTSKIAHASRSDALAALSRCEDARGERLDVYPCPFCDGFHLTRIDQEEWS